MRFFPLIVLAPLVLAGCRTTQSEPSLTKATIYFDLVHSLVPSGAVMADLKSRGFQIDPEPAYHPGQHVCQFLWLLKPLPRGQVVELCHVDQRRPLDDKVGKETAEDSWPELGLNLTQPLETYFERNKGALAAYGPSIEHKNYDWAINSNDRLPGWNFLQFSKPPIPGVNFGMTEREPSGKNRSDEAKTKRFVLMYHPNTARTFLGALIVTADPAHRKAFEAISAARPQGDRSYLADGTFVQWVKPGSDLAKNFSDKKFPLQAFVVGVSSMEKFQAAAKPEGSIDFNRKKAAHIKLVPESWDILAVELNTAEDLLPLGP